MREQLRSLLRDSAGATAVEYGLILALIVIAVVGSMMFVADTTINMWNNVSTTVTKS
jgi:pilus assembly protein Flp/PilA